MATGEPGPGYHFLEKISTPLLYISFFALLFRIWFIDIITKYDAVWGDLVSDTVSRIVFSTILVYAFYYLLRRLHYSK